MKLPVHPAEESSKVLMKLFALDRRLQKLLAELDEVQGEIDHTVRGYSDTDDGESDDGLAGVAVAV